MNKCKCDASYFLLCYSRFPPLIIEIILVSLSILGSIITYFGLSGIPFHIDSKIYKIIFLINIPYFILMIILNIIFIIFRYHDLMVNELYLWGYGLSIVEVYITVFGLTTNLINDALIISNMDYYQEICLIQNSSKYPMITSKEWLYTKIILPIILFFWANMFIMSITDNWLINLRIKDSYNNYKLALNEEIKYSQNHNKKHEEEIDNQNKNSNIKESDENNNDEEKNNNNERNNQNGINLNVDPNIKKNRVVIKSHESQKNNNNLDSSKRFNVNINNEDDIIGSINPFLNEENNMKKELKDNEEIKI